MREFSCAHTSNAIAHLQTDSCVGVSGKILVVVVARVWGSPPHDFAESNRKRFSFAFYKNHVVFKVVRVDRENFSKRDLSPLSMNPTA